MGRAATGAIRPSRQVEARDGYLLVRLVGIHSDRVVVADDASAATALVPFEARERSLPTVNDLDDEAAVLGEPPPEPIAILETELPSGWCSDTRFRFRRTERLSLAHEPVDGGRRFTAIHRRGDRCLQTTPVTETSLERFERTALLNIEDVASRESPTDASDDLEIPEQDR